VHSLSNVCVFCGSSSGTSPAFAEAARVLGTSLADQGIGLVYGGASVGLMGVLADATLAAGGRVYGVITASLADHEIAHAGLSGLDVVNTMHERKARMAALSDAFIMMPGGFGTLEEFMEAITWLHLGIHDKPCAIVNTDGFFNGLLEFVDHAVDQGFIGLKLVKRILVANDPQTLLDTLILQD
jgi:uncharacterized protein (TIGR00730 family)